MGEAQRFPLDTSRALPKGMPVIWYAFIVVIAGAGTIVLALQMNPAALLFPAFGILMIGFMHVVGKGFEKAEWNFAELADDSLRVCISGVFKPYTVEFAYRTIGRVEQHDRHRYWQGLPRGSWPYYAWGEHVDVGLRCSRFLVVGWGQAFPWVSVLHLQTAEPNRFAAALRERISGTAASDADRQ